MIGSSTCIYLLFIKPDNVIEPAIASLNSESEYEMYNSLSLNKIGQGHLGPFYKCISEYQDLKYKSKPLPKEYAHEDGGTFGMTMKFKNGVSLSFSTTQLLTRLISAEISDVNGNVERSTGYVVRCPLSLLKRNGEYPW